ncbi:MULTISPECIES: glutathione S-transferase [unclassified Pseudoalteromonas]|uniref:glutathione S-transferase family protein n=1 Tax=unclassified Pseudoalteromonas TaxID=194690 RepID=UPI000730FF40|nr:MULTISPECIES: glutathione S-transferase [unclassified Pseudoalteromonas]KTD95891.1 glutathione S-transferase [Pseudoalteromonas sp. H71]TMN79451.1 glutathione S-transferase [Pseudoalteromonas sp. S410]TMN90647.1 glutathione S-transferase [Pseudoalteromonas sp. S408]TMN95227.1 glutathione S-transferase [Pseudoalteromonas sp. S407]TMN98360.1 glutathione S-transferase [Pseudoalteromonas sp. S409]
MKIYDVENFPNPLRVRIALAEKNATADVEFISVDLLNGEHRTEAFLAKNPLAGVPVLELDDGTFISECTAITEYIDTAFTGPSLMGISAKERAVINMMQKRAESMVLDAVATYFHHATDGLGPELETYQNVEWGEKQGEKARSSLNYFNDILAQTTFVAGDSFSIADITLYAGLVFAGFANIALPSNLTHLLAWQKAVAARPSVAGL